MKRLPSLLLVLASAAALLSSCEKGRLKTESFQEESVGTLSEGWSDTLKIKLDIEYPVGGISSKAVESMTKSILSTALDSTVTDTDVSKACEAYMEKLRASYKADFDSLARYVAESEYERYPVTWEKLVTGSFAGRHDNVISYEIESYTYEGGAHGLSGKTCLNFDISSGGRIDEAGFFEDGTREELAGLLTSHVRESLEDDDAYEALFVKDIEPNGNFEVSDEGVTYVYGNYEIGPYYLGIIEVTVPWDEILPLVRVEKK